MYYEKLRKPENILVMYLRRVLIKHPFLLAYSTMTTTYILFILLISE